MIKYKRILLKLSGESLMGDKKFGIDENRLNDYAEQIAHLVKKGVQIGIVIGGGNIFRGYSGTTKGFNRIKGDQMGMLATVINSLALSSYLVSAGLQPRVFTAIKMEPIAEYYVSQEAVRALINGEVVIIAAGTGNPFFTTDTASALRAVEIGAEIMLKGTRVDGVYSADPEKDPKAVKFDRISFNEVYDKNLRIMDLTAATLCRENNLPVLVFNMDKKGNLEKLILGENIGTLILLIHF